MEQPQTYKQIYQIIKRERKKIGITKYLIIMILLLNCRKFLQINDILRNKQLENVTYDYQLYTKWLAIRIPYQVLVMDPRNL